MTALKNKESEQYSDDFIDAAYLDKDQRERLQHIKWLIRSHSKNKLRWDVVVMLLAIFNCFAIPVAVAFQPDFMETWYFLLINSIIDCLFFVDLIVYFRTTFIHNKTGNEIIEPKEIAKSYLKGRFWVDLLATIPFDTFAGIIIGSESSSFLAIFSLLKLVRVLRLNRIISIMKVGNEIKLSLKLGKLVFFLSMYLHWLGCFWYYLAKDNKKWIPPLDYVFVTTDFYNEDLFFQYLSSLYHAVLMLTGNDIGPRNEVQLIFLTAALGMGAIINANIIGELAVILSKLNRRAAHFQGKLDTANDAMRHLGLPEKIQVEITGFLTYSKALLESQEELEEFLSMISPSHRQKVLKHMFTQALLKNSIFQKSISMIEFFSARLETHILLPDYTLLTQGEAGDSLFAISKGAVTVLVTDHKGKTSSIRNLEVGEIFGEVALLCGWKRTATIKTIQYSTIAQLSKQNYDTVCRVYPVFQVRLKKQLRSYNDPLNQFIRKALRNIYYLENISENSIEEIIFYLDLQHHDYGETLFRIGDSVDEITIVASGEIQVLIGIDEREVVIDTLREGWVIGFNSVLKDSNHTFTAKCKTKASVYTLSKETLKNLFNIWEDLYKEARLAKKFFASEDMPCIDFCLPKHDFIQKSKRPIRIFRTVVQRLLRINHNLGKFANAFDIIEKMKKVIKTKSDFSKE